MSTESGSDGTRSVSVDADATVGSELFRVLALGCVLIATASYVTVLREVTRIVGGTQSLFLVVGVALVVATVFARLVRPRTATAAAFAAGAVGFAYYFEVSGVGIGGALAGLEEIVADTVRLATGLNLLRMIEAGTWTIVFAPAPAFLSWYLALRGRYAASVVPAGAALLFLVLTGDAGTTATLIGALGALGAVGFGELERRGGSIAQADVLAVLFAIVIVLSLSVTIVPSGPAAPVTAGGGDDGTLEGTIDSASEQSGIAGTVDLSPEVRFTVEADRPSYWRTGIYDRYTGDAWVRTGQDRPFEDDVPPPPGSEERLRQTVTAETELGVMPAAAQPLSVEGDVVDYTEVSMHGQIRPATPLAEGDSYVVESAIVDPSPEELRNAGTDYPEEVTEYYLQTPEGTSSEFEARTAEITADAETPYENAVAIERYLRSSKEYSLDVEPPEEDAAEQFLLEMDEGYCVYFATAMTQMLRAEDVPTRYVTGYTAGEPTDDGEYVVRGLDAHAWVEVYFPEKGWVAFEPTPGDERDEVHDEALEEELDDEAGDEDDQSDGDDADDGADDEASDEDDRSGVDDADDEPSVDDPADDLIERNDALAGGEPADDGIDVRDILALVSVTRETAAMIAVVLIGLVAGVHRTGAVARARRTLGVYRHGRRSDPDRDAERAFRRLEWLLAREHRPRRRGESAREYLRALAAETDDGLAHDPRTAAVLERYERAVYGGGVDRETADESIAAVDDLSRERVPLVGRRRSEGAE
ncbi:transglutaminase TgpA family protein [Natrarchaeobius oligotrophus]|uniref:DUF4129 domain-containing protein n=1 Tax=Natrarchaeobius chitinivorans TaxID=1679083 RepID=A0A3N6MTL7_NATCH|nr:DUF3488 and transglutaminase-like domain-containing protein [Natrarchaeobius chitinivorans]RQH01221.1 DUF4129 domain-containing protein [Natrarchaeobius chitinivorans]